MRTVAPVHPPWMDDVLCTETGHERHEVDSRIDGRGVSRTFVDASDRIGGESKTAPAGNRGLTDTPKQEVMPAMGNRSNGTIEESARAFLKLCRDEHAKAVRKRIYFAALARRHGMTNEAIGDALGISEGAVRSMLARHPDALDPDWFGGDR